jgi:hypothetical protein
MTAGLGQNLTISATAGTFTLLGTPLSQETVYLLLF